MKKLTLLLVALVGLATTVSAQNFDMSTKNVTLAVGFGGGYGIPIAISYEQGVYDFGGDHKLGAGVYLGLGDSFSYIAPAAECNYHFVGISKLDLYGGVRLGYGIANSYGEFFTSFDIGANYYLNSTWAINCELGSGLGALGLGVSYNF